MPSNMTPPAGTVTREPMPPARDDDGRCLAGFVLRTSIAHHKAEQERLQAELNAAVELHDRSMALIESALPKPRKNRDTWRADAIRLDIEDLKATWVGTCAACGWPLKDGACLRMGCCNSD